MVVEEIKEVAMKVENDRDGKPHSKVLLVSLEENDSELHRIIVKNTSFFFLEPKELELLKQATMKQIILTDIEFIIGISRNHDNQFVVTSIYDKNGSYQNNLFDYCRVGDVVDGLPDNFRTARRFRIK